MRRIIPSFFAIAVVIVFNAIPCHAQETSPAPNLDFITAPEKSPAVSEVVSAPTPVPPVVESWQPKSVWSGDLRYRAIRTKEAEDEVRPFQQLRARLGIKADVNPKVQGIVRLATGTSSISTNQTLGDPKDPGMQRRNFGVDLAYVDMSVVLDGSIWIGRTANPFWSPAKSQIIYDSDLAFEGLAMKWSLPLETVTPFINAGAFMISENYAAPSDAVDQGLVAAEIGMTLMAIGTWTLHLGTHQYVNIRNMPITAFDKDAKTDAYSYPYDRYKGNTVYPNDPLLPPDTRKYFFQHGYVLFEFGFEGKIPLGAFDLSVFYEEVRNDQTSVENMAHEYGVGLKYGGWQVGWAESMKGANSLVGAFTDSDMSGGGTDNKGTRMSLSYQLMKNVQASATRYEAKRGVKSVERKYAATLLDLMVAF